VCDDFTLTAAGPTRSRGGGVSSVPVPAGTYTLSETGPAGYTPGALDMHWCIQPGARSTWLRGESASARSQRRHLKRGRTEFRPAPKRPRRLHRRRWHYEYTRRTPIITVAASVATWRSVSGGTRVVGRLPGTQHPEPARTWDVHRPHALPVHNPTWRVSWYGEARCKHRTLRDRTSTA